MINQDFLDKYMPAPNGRITFEQGEQIKAEDLIEILRQRFDGNAQLEVLIDQGVGTILIQTTQGVSHE